MSYDVVTTKRFDKALKRCVKRGLEMSKLTTAIGILAREGSLPAIYRPVSHSLYVELCFSRLRAG